MDRTEGKIALHLVAQYGHTLAAKVLHNHGADIEAHGDACGPPIDVYRRTGRTPLHWTAAGVDSGGRQESIVRFLIDRGADIMAQSTTG